VSFSWRAQQRSPSEKQNRKTARQLTVISGAPPLPMVPKIKILAFKNISNQLHMVRLTIVTTVWCKCNAPQSLWPWVLCLIGIQVCRFLRSCCTVPFHPLSDISLLLGLHFRTRLPIHERCLPLGSSLVRCFASNEQVHPMKLTY
jgi:hypothetical protein